ncbi:MAG: DnaJ family molecular chaperone [Candidatus Sericytochromatia bacterium]
MGDILKRLVNLAKAEISHLHQPDRELSEEFKAWFSHQPGYDNYREAFDREYDRQHGQGYSQQSSGQKRSHNQNTYHDNQGYDPYKTLEVSSSASWEEIEKAYKKLARKYHPDRFQNAEERETATRVMALINASFGFLKEKHGKK